MWKHLVLTGASLLALRSAAQEAPVEWSYVNQTLREISQDALGSFPFLRSLELEFDEQYSNLQNGQLSLQFRAGTDQMKWEGGRAEMSLGLKLADNGPIADGKRPVKALISVEMKTATLAALQTYFESESSGCEGLSTREESYSKFKDQMLCPLWDGLKSAHSVQDIHALLSDLKAKALKSLPEYLKSAKGNDLKKAQEDLAMVQKLKLAYENGLMTMNLGFDWVSLEKLRVDLRLRLSDQKMSFDISVVANAEETKYQQAKAELLKWLMKLQDKDSNTLNILRLATYAYGQNLSQRVAQ